MRWQDTAVTVTAAEHRTSEYWFPFERNMKAHNIHGLKKSKFIPSKLLWPLRRGRAGGPGGGTDRCVRRVSEKLSPLSELCDQDGHVTRFRVGEEIGWRFPQTCARSRPGESAHPRRSQGTLATSLEAAPAAGRVRSIPHLPPNTFSILNGAR